MNGDFWTTTTSAFARINGTTRNLATVIFALTDATTIAVDASLGDVQTVTIAGNRTMAAPTNPRDGQLLLFKIKQGGSGSYTITWNAVYQFTATIPAPVLSTTVGISDYIGFIYDAVSARWNCLTYALYYS